MRLKKSDFMDETKRLQFLCTGRMIHPVEGELSFQRYGKDDSEYINAVSRADLNIALMNLAEKNSNVRFHFNERCSGIDFKMPMQFSGMI